MPLFLIAFLNTFTLALAVTHAIAFQGVWMYTLVYYAVNAIGDTLTTWWGLARGYREANPLYARALALTPWGIFLVDLGKISLLALTLPRLGLDPLTAYPVAFTIAGHGHLVGFLWNWGTLLERR